MKNQIVFILFFSISLSIASFAQTKNDTIQKLQISVEKLEVTNLAMEQEIQAAYADIKKLEAESKKLLRQFNIANSNALKTENKLSTTIDSMRFLEEKLAKTTSNLNSIANSLDVKIQQTSKKASADLSTLNEKVGKNTLYWIIAVLFIALLSVLLFGWLRKRLSREKTDLSAQIKKTSETLRDEQLKLDEQLIKLLDTQMQLMKEERHATSAKAVEVDHSLALKVADEITRIQQNLNSMDSESKGLKQLSASVKRIQANFEGNGYEIVDMLNKPYDAGMKVTANFKPDERMKENEQIITRIIKPQVDYKGLMIQSAQIEVSQGE